MPSGAISVFSEAYLNSRASGFPFGTPQPPGASQAARSLMFLASKYEQLAQWISEQSPWIKYTLGTGLLIGTAVGVTAYTIATGGVNPHAWLAVAGAIAGAGGGGIEASLAGGDFSDVILSAGIGAVFGAICPPAAIGGLAGGGIAALGAYALGGDRNTIATAYQWGSLVGGLAGDFTGGALTAGKFLSMRALRAGVTHVGPDLLGAGVGAIIGYSLDGTSTSALHGANLGMMAGGIASGLGRRFALRGVNRARRSYSHALTGQIAGDSPTVRWQLNPGGEARTIEEAVLIAKQHGVSIPDDVAFFIDELGELGADITARGPKVRKPAGGNVRWNVDFLNRFGKVPFIVRPDILRSDEAIVAVFAHEIYEVQALRKILQKRGTIAIEEFIAHTMAGNPGNLHSQAWEVADALVLRMRG